jgi:hypothetical protein
MRLIVSSVKQNIFASRLMIPQNRSDFDPRVDFATPGNQALTELD